VELMVAFAAWMAKEELRRRSERTKAGWPEHARKGGSAGGLPRSSTG